MMRSINHKFIKSVVIFSMALLLFCGLLLTISQCLQVANASEDNASISASLNIKIDTNGAKGGASAKLEKTSYNAGETVVIKWNGAKVANSNDFIIPTSVTYDGTGQSLDIKKFIEADKIQSPNTAYKKEMGEDVTMTTFEDMSKYLTSSHSYSMGKLTVGGTITVNFQRVSPVYRLYNKVTSEHLFTTNKNEYDKYVNLLSQGKDFWIGEGIDWLSPKTGTNVKRLYNAGLGSLFRSSHYYTSDDAEIKDLTTNYGWVEDPEENWFMSGGTSGASTSATSTNNSLPIYTAYSEALGSSHHYTSSWDEWRGLDGGWDKEDKKNGLSADGKSATGVIKALVGTNWRFTDNYYQVQHVINGAVADTQYMTGKTGEQTKACANSYPGYKVSGAIKQKTIEGNSTVVEINYEPVKYRISFDVNGHGLKPDDLVANYGDKIKAPTLESKGYVFAGWFYDATCSAGNEVKWTTMPATDMTVYAKWTSNSYIVKFDVNGGTGTAPASKTVEIGTKDQVFPESTGFSKENCRFDGWALSASPSSTDKVYQPGEAIDNLTTEPGTEIVVYAKWKTQVTVKFNTQGRGTTPDPQVIDVATMATEVTATELGEKPAGLKFEGWYEDPYCRGNKFDFSTRVLADKTLTANWVVDNDAAESDNAYWIGFSTTKTLSNSADPINTPAYVSEQWNVKRSAAEIRDDVKKILAGDETTKAMYQSWIECECFHLYTKWNGEKKAQQGTVTGKDDYVEFRILQVGAHDGDGAALTFQAVHSLPIADAMKDSNTYTGGWAQSDLRTALQENGEIYKKFSTVLTNDIMKVKKKTTTGDKKTEVTESEDKFFITSLTEVFGSVEAATAPSEGTQYNYFNVNYKDSNKLNVAGNNNALVRGLRSSRATIPSGNTQESVGGWWTRTASLNKENSYIVIDHQGNPSNAYEAKDSYGVVPAFAFGAKADVPTEG